MGWADYLSQGGRTFSPAPSGNSGFEVNRQLQRLWSFNEQHVVSVRACGAVGDGTTDDTAAFAAACAALSGYKQNLYGGWYGRVPVLSVPAGRYKITSSDAFLPLVGASEGIEGWIIRGAGPASRILFSGSDYLIKNESKFGYSIIEGLFLEASGSGRKAILLKSLADGIAQQFRIADVRMSGFAEGITARGTVNTSEVWLQRVNIGEVPASGFAVDVDNEQSVNWQMDRCDVGLAASGATGIRFRSGGNLLCNNLNAIVENGGRLLDLNASGATGGTFGQGNNQFVFNNLRPELRGASSRLLRMSGTIDVTLRNALLGAVNNASVDDVIEIVDSGNLFLDGCDVPSNCRIDITSAGGSAYTSRWAPSVLIQESNITDLYDLVTIGYSSGSNPGSLGRVEAYGCRRYGYDAETEKHPVDVALNATYGQVTRGVRTKRFIWTYGPQGVDSLPMTNSGGTATATFNLPRGALILKVTLVRTADSSFAAAYGGTTFTSRVRLHDDTLLAEIAAHAANAAQAVDDSTAHLTSQFPFLIDSEAKRTIKVQGTGNNSIYGGVPGYVLVEYL